MVEEGSHIHLENDIEGVELLSEAEDRLFHEAVQLRNVRLPLKVGIQAGFNVLVQSLALRNQRVDVALTDLPRDAVDEQGVLDGVVLA
eukprot:CAMPEP_0170513290 /NCGR_PEP_ID=MMETSP0208-20121228/67322_1 /TAXON_ID=197538 /ORGANISM="Strombidium inclinatum, Strain S3" /LENGTH=87 /DNA_ID=CAMNT_0010797013 /DNA_START=669 /DNA_END=929 /DNA_ORIENTATION=+